MVSPLQFITAQAGVVSTSQLPSSVHIKDDKVSLSVPNTPSSSSASAGSSSHRNSVHIHRHRKASSLSSSAPLLRPTSKAHSRSLSLHELQLQSLSFSSPLNESRVLESNERGEVKSASVMVTPPENLPPSPPLTSRDTDSADVDEDSEEVAPAESQNERQDEEDITEAWPESIAESRQSREITHEHPLDDDSPTDARVDVDLEKGLEQPVSQGRTRPASEVDVLQQARVTKAFEVTRRPKRTGSLKPPHSSYYIGPPTGTTAYSTPPCGQIGVHHPREIVRIERDYDHGELVQFSTSYPLELQDRITPTQFLETINALNEGLIRAHSLTGACIDNTLAIFTLWMSTFFIESTYDREMRRLQQLVNALNAELYNPQGLNILWPRKCAFLFLEIEYY